MFERFTEQARRVLFFAREDASQLGSIRIDTEHLLLGLTRDGKGLTHRLFADAGTALDDIRDEVLRRIPARSATSATQEIPFSAAAQRVLQHSAEEADRLLHDRAAVRVVGDTRNATARCLGCEKHWPRRTDASLLWRAGGG